LAAVLGKHVALFNVLGAARELGGWDVADSGMVRHAP
jgi:hypothetical protein